MKLCPTLCGYSAEPLPPAPEFAPKLHLFRPRTLSGPTRGGLANRKYPVPRVGDRLGCYEVMGLSRGRQGRADLDVRVLCDCGVTDQLFEHQLRRHLARGDTCRHRSRLPRCSAPTLNARKGATTCARPAGDDGLCTLHRMRART